MGDYSSNVIGNYLASCAINQPDELCAVYGDRRITWGQINDRVNRLAQALLKMGVKKDDKVTMMFHNCLEFIETNWAIQKVGAIPVPMNYRYTAREIEYQVTHSDSVIFILEDIWLDAVSQARPALRDIREFICSGPNRPDDMLDYEQVISEHEPIEPNVPTQMDDTCVMIYTGGTTGPSKGVMLSYGAHVDMFEAFYANMVLRVVQLDLSPEQRDSFARALAVPGTGLLLNIFRLGPIRKIMASQAAERLVRAVLRKLLTSTGLLKLNYGKKLGWMIPSLPLFHDASYQLLVLCSIVGNNVLYFTEGVSMNPEAVFKMIQKEAVMFMANVPTGWKKLADSPQIGNYDLSSMIIAATGAGVNPASLKKKMMEKLPGIIILDMFGQTEMTPITTMRIDISPDTLKDRSVGRSIVESKIVDEDGKEVAEGQIGEILYKSSTTMKGYYKDEEKTSESFVDGWFKGGDLGYLDEDGEIRVVERKNECISTGGEKIFPGEIEEILETHPMVEKACVIGVPDEEWGSTVRAVIMPKGNGKVSEQEIIDFCKDKMAGYKKPRSVVFSQDFPMSPVGKVLRAKIRENFGK